MMKKDAKGVIFPVIDSKCEAKDKEIIEIFIQRYRDINFMRAEIKILSSIEKTADLTGNSIGIITKILVDNGLRASRKSLPQEFLDHIDNLTLRAKGRFGGMLYMPYEELKEFWADQGEDVYAFQGSVYGNHELSSFLST